jgi:hypothetical protein
LRRARCLSDKQSRGHAKLRSLLPPAVGNLASALGVSHVELVTPDDEARREAAKASGGRSSKRRVRKDVKQVRPPGTARPGAATLRWKNRWEVAAERSPARSSRAGLAAGLALVAVRLAAARPDEGEGLAVLDEVGVDRCREARIVKLDREIVAALVGALRPGGPDLGVMRCTA